MAVSSRRLLVGPALLACFGIAVFTAMPMLTERLGLGPDGGAALLLHHVSGIWTFLALAWLTARCGDVLLRRMAMVSRGGVAYPRLLLDLLRAALFVIAGLLILQFVFGQSAGGLIAVSSVVIAVVGFALRNVISDVVSGIALGIEHPYRIGDWIETTQGSSGKVSEITWRTTRLTERNGFVFVVPNGLIAGQRLINYSGGERDYRTALRVPLDAMLAVDQAKRVLLSGALDAGRQIPGLSPDVLLSEFSDGAAVYLVRFRVPDFGQEARCRDLVASRVLHALSCVGWTIRQTWIGTASGGPVAEAPPRPREALLMQVALFRGFEPAERVELAAAMRMHEVVAGQTVVRQGDPGDCLYVIGEGILEVEIDRGEATSIIDTIAPGEVFGEISLLTGAPRSATVRAAIDSVVYEITRSDLDPILRRRPEIAEGLSTVMAERQARNDRESRTDEPVAAVLRGDLLARLRWLFHL
jgi:small-conductance mechanosensitive channel/CRP-like cAMP-binding protein